METTQITRSASTPMAVFLGAAAVGAVVLAVAPEVVGYTVLFAMPIGLLAAIECGIRRHRPARPEFWQLLQLSFLVLVGSGVIAVVRMATQADKGLADELSMVVYLPLIAGLIVLLRQRTRGLGPLGLIDAAIVTGGAGAVVWAVVIDPVVESSGMTLQQKALVIVWPVFDLVLFGLFFALSGDAGKRPIAYWLMMSAIALELVADVFYATPVGALPIVRRLMPEVWLVAYAAFGAAALHPSMARLAEPERRSWRSGPLRLAGLGIAALVAPVVVTVTEIRETSLGDAAGIALVGGLVPILLVWRTLLERSRAETALREVVRQSEQVRALQELTALKDRIITAVSHELRTPLTAVIGYAKTLDGLGHRLTADQQQDLAHRLALQTDRLSGVLASLLDVNGLRDGAIAPDVGRVDMGAVVRNAVVGVADADHVRVAADPVVAVADGRMVDRIVRNLLVNAIKHTPVGTPIWVGVSDSPEGVAISVDDAGPGVAPEQREAIFGEFEHGSQVSAHSPGLGMGLAIVRRLAEAHGGRAWVEDRDGGGASFRVLLPQRGQRMPSLVGASAA